MLNDFFFLFQIQPTLCCQYGTAGDKTSGYDCLTIPGAVKNTAIMKAVPERLCGRQFIDLTMTFTGTEKKGATVCCKYQWISNIFKINQNIKSSERVTHNC